MDQLAIRGVYRAQCFDLAGRLRWSDVFPNTVMTLGKNFILDMSLAGSAYTAADFMGLISSVSYSAIAATDTMAAHPGWTEAGTTNTPTYSGTRLSAAWAAATGGAKAFSANLSFPITGAGTLKGAFLVGGSGASNAIMNTGGVLISAGLFTGGDRVVLAGDVVTVSYSMSI